MVEPISFKPGKSRPPREVNPLPDTDKRCAPDVELIAGTLYRRDRLGIVVEVTDNELHCWH